MMGMNTGQSTTVREETLTEKRLKAMADVIQNLAHNLDALKGEMSQYLAPDSPPVANCKTQEARMPEQIGSQLTDTLSGLTQSIETLTVLVLDIRGRIR